MIQSIRSLCCEHPNFIINPRLRFLINFCDLLVTPNFERFITPEMRQRFIDGDSFSSIFKVSFPQFLDFDKFNQSPFSERMSYDGYIDYFDNLLNSFCLVVSDTGESYPCFVAVKCGHCDSCLYSKYQNLLLRVQLHQQVCSSFPLYLTLTYNDNHLPYHGVSVRHMQLFKKRLKKCVTKLVSADAAAKIKFLIVSEYTPSNHRPHYHMLVLDFPRLSDNDVRNQYLRYHVFMYCYRMPELHDDKFTYVTFEEYRQRYPLIFDRPANYDPLSYGFINCQEVDSFKSLGYITKYVFKQTDYKKTHYWDGVRMHGNFMLTPLNLGVEFVKMFRDVLLSSKDGTFQYKDCLSGAVNTVSLNSYYLKKIFPSECQLIPSSIRNDLVNFRTLSDFVFRSSSFSAEQKELVFAASEVIKSRFPCFDFRPVNSASYTRNASSVSDYLLIHRLFGCYDNLFNFSFDYDCYKACIAARELYLFKLSQNKQPPNTLNISRKFDKHRRDMQSRSVLT